MAELLIRHGEWVVVCDGAKALILENAGDTKFPNLKTIKVLEQKDLPTHALGTDAPGRTNNSVGSARSAVEQTDWHDQSERTFLVQLAHQLDGAVTAGKAKSLIVVAPPRALSSRLNRSAKMTTTAMAAPITARSGQGGRREGGWPPV